MSFDNVRLSDEVERGAVGGPRFSTNIITTSGGFEKRNTQWAVPRYEYRISFGAREREDIFPIVDFFMARQGAARGFLFKDWTDYSHRSVIGVGDGVKTQFQAVKIYTSGFSFVRPLQKIKNGQKIYFDNVLQPTPAVYTWLNATGVITFAAPPPNGVVIELEGEFDVPVRFNVDKLDITALTSNVMDLPGLDLIEVKIPLTL